MIAVLLITGVSPAVYDAQMTGISWLLTPATVCLAVPLHRHLKTLKKNLPAVIAGVVAGTLSSLVCILLMCSLFALDRQFTVSLLPKSITTAIGIVLSEQNSGIPTLTFVSILITGILGNLMGSFLCKCLRLTDPVSQGVAFGTASHLVGTTRAAEVHPIAGAVSSLSLVIAGILTAIVFPLIMLIL